MTYKHPLFEECLGDTAFCIHCERFISTQDVVARGWTCPECGPATSAWDIRPAWVGEEYLERKRGRIERLRRWWDAF